MTDKNLQHSTYGVQHSIPHSRPAVGEEESDRVREVILSRQLAQGPQVKTFEAEMGQLLGLPPGVAVSSGTAALYLALKALDVKEGDEVLLPSYVCTAPLHAISHVGARPVPVDVDPETGNTDPKDLRKRLTPQSKAIIAVHLSGLPAPMKDLLAFGLPVVEDCAQSLGAFDGAQPTGTMGALGICSFYATKVITTGEGGMVFSPHASYLERVRDLRDYDKKEIFIPRFNYKMSDVAAALGRCQLSKLNRFLDERRRLAEAYDEQLAGASCTLPPKAEGRIYYRYVIKIRDEVTDVIDRLAHRGIETARPIFKPIHHYLGLEGYPGTEECWKTHLSLPLYPGLSPEAVEMVCTALEKAGRRKS